jgi:hypothetical protein
LWEEGIKAREEGEREVDIRQSRITGGNNMGKNIALKNMLKRQMGATRTVMGVERIKVRIAEQYSGEEKRKERI